ncbi:hypothetical protein [Flavobacterium sp. FlaQc-50]|uniref:hypothetical protein n=1 Tax=unclassified Flavobacterium TaxID=196869 RepID=UPI0037580709
MSNSVQINDTISKSVMDENAKLQASRRKSIPDLVAKYQKLVDLIFDAVAKPLPVFVDKQLDNEGNEKTIITAEQQMFSFINVRNHALDNADAMMIKINMLEMELNAPELFALQSKVEEEVKDDKPIINRNPTKKYAQKDKQ